MADKKTTGAKGAKPKGGDKPVSGRATNQGAGKPADAPKQSGTSGGKKG